MKSALVAALALALSILPSVTLAALILVEDDRFIETNFDGAVTRLESPGDPSWSAASTPTPEFPGSGYGANQQSTFSPTSLSGFGGTFVTLDGFISQKATSTFDMSFEVDRPTLVSLSGNFREPAIDGGYYTRTTQLLFTEDSALLLGTPTEGTPPYGVPIPFRLDAILTSESVYRLFIEGSVSETSDTTGGTDIVQSWSFTLEVPELPAIALLPLVLLALGAIRRELFRLTAMLPLILSLLPSEALAALTLVEDNRFIETTTPAGVVTRLESPGESSWDGFLSSDPNADQRTTVSPISMGGLGGTSLKLDGGSPQLASSTFDVLLRVDRQPSYR